MNNNNNTLIKASAFLYIYTILQVWKLTIWSRCGCGYLYPLLSKSLHTSIKHTSTSALRPSSTCSFSDCNKNRLAALGSLVPADPTSRGLATNGLSVAGLLSDALTRRSLHGRSYRYDDCGTKVH